MVKERSRLAGGWLLAAPAVAAAIFLAVHAPIPQDPDYHRFADQRGVWIVPRAGDVLSNAAFLLAKLLEINDAAIFHFTGIVSGHTLKHLAAAGAAILLA